MFDTIIDQEKPIARLLAMVANNSVPHALLFSGPEGSGKVASALSFAMALNCRSTDHSAMPTGDIPGTFNALACLNCSSCNKISANSHPDIITIKPSGNMIRIARIRELCSTLLTKPYEAAKRIVIIDGAGAMNAESANALLKVLEEPPNNTQFILTTTQASGLLPTILSRCQQISFRPLSPESILRFVMEHHPLSREQANAISSLANGNLKKAVELCENPKAFNTLFKLRHWITNETGKLIHGTADIPLLFAEKISSGKETVSESLEIMLTFIRDLMVYKFCPDKIINKDLSETIKHLTNDFPLKTLLDITRHIQSAQQDIRANSSLRLTLEVMALKIARA